MGGGRRRQRGNLAEPFRRGEASGEEPNRRGLDVAFASGDLPGKTQPRHCLEPKRRIEQLRRIEKRVAVQAAEPRELRAGKARDGAEYPDLIAVLQFGLEAHHVEQGAELVVLPQLHDRVGLLRGLMRIGETERLHRPEGQHALQAAVGHHLDGQAALEVKLGLLEIAERNLLAVK